MLINIGFGNYINSDKIIAIVNPHTLPMRNLIRDARNKGSVIDVTCGRKTRTILVTDSGKYILSALQTNTVSCRNNNYLKNLKSKMEKREFNYDDKTKCSRTIGKSR